MENVITHNKCSKCAQLTVMHDLHTNTFSRYDCVKIENVHCSEVKKKLQ